MKKSLILLIIFFTPPLYSQHEQHTSPQQMSHKFSIDLPMNVNGSGTGWLPESSPMYGYMLHSDNWMVMIHGQVYGRYNKQDINNTGTRGGEKWDVPNWLMLMGQSRTGLNGLFSFSTMFSLDPVTVGGEGYPLLFQSGETYNGEPLVDRQHPHDLFSELAIGYSHRISRQSDIIFYFGYPGEPALGPVAFMHRPSTMNNPDAPLSHHWQDATHITFGVGTLGLRFGMFKIEGSVFTGREPDEERYRFDKPKFDSYSGRISVLPTKDISGQVSYGYLKSPEVLNSGVNVKRVTASVLHSFNFPEYNRNINSALIWGLNDQGDHHKEHSLLLESNYQLNRIAIYGRYEFIQKSSEELKMEVPEEEIYNLSALTIGANYTFLERFNTGFSIGAQTTFNFPDRRIQNVYGKNPVSAEVYLRINPSLMMQMDQMQEKIEHRHH
jgi:hypothetical protein